MRHLQQCQESNRLDLQVLLQRNACQLDLKSFKVLESFSYKAKIAEYVRSYVVYFFLSGYEFYEFSITLCMNLFELDVVPVILGENTKPYQN